MYLLSGYPELLSNFPQNLNSVATLSLLISCSVLWQTWLPLLHATCNLPEGNVVAVGCAAIIVAASAAAATRIFHIFSLIALAGRTFHCVCCLTCSVQLVFCQLIDAPLQRTQTHILDWVGGGQWQEAEGQQWQEAGGR